MESVRVHASNPDGYKAYVAANAEPFRKYGAKFLVRGGQIENPEGSSRTRNVVREFKDSRPRSPATSRPDSSHASALRTPNSVGDIVIARL